MKALIIDDEIDICFLLSAILKNADIAKRLDAQGIDIVGGTPSDARVFIERQMVIWDKVVKENNIKAD